MKIKKATKYRESEIFIFIDQTCYCFYLRTKTIRKVKKTTGEFYEEMNLKEALELIKNTWGTFPDLPSYQKARY